ncbi:MAG: PAS domain S-box protein [Sulfuritalea sp.]|nr:PAS domain S-box protein [Sulfuritalea sp.]
MHGQKVGAGSPCVPGIPLRGQVTAIAQADAAATPRDEAVGLGRWRWLAALALVVALVVVAITKIYVPQLERDAYASLEIAARLKAQQVESWLDERHSDGRVIATDAEFIERIADIRRRADPEKVASIRRRLDAIADGYGYAASYLLDPQGEVLLASEARHQLSANTLAMLPRVFANGQVAQSAFYIDANDGQPGLNFVIPLQRTVGGKRQPVAAVVLHAEPHESIFSLILAWPSTSRTSETLLVQAEGESVVYLTQLRHQENAALQFKRPLADPRLPAAIAIRSGRAGMVHGRDYRGTEVLAAYRPVAGTDWHLIAKIDYEEVMAPLWQLVGWVGLVALTAILAIGLMLRRLWSQRQRLQRLAAKARLVESLRQREERFRAVTETAYDAIVTADADGKIVSWNASASRMFGFDKAEIIGQPLTRIIPPRFQQAAMAGFGRLMNGDPDEKDRSIAELIGRRKDDSEFLLERSIALWQTEDGRFFTCTMRDIAERRKAENALRDSTIMLNEAQRIAHVGSWTLDVGNGELIWSDEVFRLFEIDPNRFSATYEAFLDLIHPDDRDAVSQAYADSLAMRQPYDITHRLRMSDGRIKWVHEKGLSEFDAAGKPLRSHGTVQDITERKQQEEQSRQLLALHETILNNALVGIVYLRQRKIISCNRRLEEIFRYEPGELLGESTEQLYDSRETYEHIGEVAYQAVGEGRNYSCEVMLRHKDGSVFWGALNGRAIDPADPHEGSIWIYADISERRRAEEESSKLKQAVEQSPVSILITNRMGVIEYINPSFTRITGYSREEAIGKTPDILKSGETPRETFEELWRTIFAGKTWHGILRNRCKNGDLIWEDTSISPIYNEDGEITHFVAVKEDVTARKRIEQELEVHQTQLEDLVLQRTVELNEALAAARLADQSKDEFLANITHELRTPLSAVIGFSSLARPFASDARQREYLDKVNSAGKTLAGIIDDLLDLSKIVAGRMDFEMRSFSLRQVVARSRSVISFKAQEKGLQLIERISDEIPDVLLGDSLRVEQILLNLLSNAVKFTESGHVELRVDLLAREADRVCLDIEVEDTGIGLSEEGIALLFKPFSQADASMTRKFGGTGLGLAICKRLAELMDGGISVTSSEGSGSTFRVKLCFALGEASDLPAAENGHESAQVRYRDARVLVVDDQPFNRDVVEGLLAAVGITPHLAENGQQALDAIALGSETFDLILMDIQMPIMDGLTATRVIRKLDGFAELPIIAMTAHTMAHEREKSVDAGMNDHIGKPFDEAGFYRVLAKWIPRGKQFMAAAAGPRPPSGNGLPALAGVDTRAGLALLLGDEARYRHWLGDFVAEAPAAMKQIRQALAAGTADAASMAAHTLKGRMGLLGMKPLHAIAASLETAIDAGAPASELLLDLERGVAAMCCEIQQGLGAVAPAELAAAAVADELPPGVPPACVTRLIEHLLEGDSDSDLLVAKCLAELKDTAWAPHLQQALSHIRNFDFAAAGAVLSGRRQAQKEKG